MEKYRNLATITQDENFNYKLIRPGVTKFKLSDTGRKPSLKSYGIVVCPKCSFAQTPEPQFCERCSWEIQKPFNKSTK